MPNIESALLDMGRFDVLAAQDTPVHRRDARAKVITAFAFVATVVSYNKYDISGLIPLFAYPVALGAVANLPVTYLLGKLLIASPFALIVGLPNPFLDRAIVATIGPWGISGGWISYASILLRFILTLSAALILISTTGFNSICLALDRMKMPKVLTLQFMLLYRYIFVLGDEAARMLKAWTLRSISDKRMPLRIFVSLVGQMLIRAIDRAQRIHMAMLSRGFDGEMRMLRPLRLSIVDVVFVGGWIGFFVLVRNFDFAKALGNIAMGTR